MIGQTAEIAPADKFLYALRDATATVESIPLIAASIMSKKLAEGIDGLVLDVKTGDGAFMDGARRLADAGRDDVRDRPGLGKQMVALITRMDQPLGRAVGNAVEVVESVECLRGEGPDDLVDLSIELAAEMVVMGGRAGRSTRRGRSAGRRSPTARPWSGSGGWSRPRGAIRGWSTTRRSCRPPRRRVEVPSPRERDRRSAWPRGRSATRRCCWGPGGRGWTRRSITPSGCILHKKIGDPVDEGEPLCTLLVNDESRLSEAETLIAGCVRHRR